MSEDEELTLKILALFEKADVIQMAYFQERPQKDELNWKLVGNFIQLVLEREKNYIESQENNLRHHIGYTRTAKGKSAYQRLKQKENDAITARLHFEDEKLLLRIVHGSVLETNESTRITNTLNRKLSRNQIWAIWVSVIIALLTLAVLYMQLQLQGEQTNKDNLIRQNQAELEQMQSQKQATIQSLDSMRVLLIQERAKNKLPIKFDSTEKH